MPRRLGQHFLRDGRVLDAIIRALELSEKDYVVEIGPGEGVLTRDIAAAGVRLKAIELDANLAEGLIDQFHDVPNVEIIHANALEIDPCVLTETSAHGFKLAGNIPYYITGSLLRKFLHGSCRPSLAVLTVQFEVAERIMARPGNMNLLAVATQLWAEPRLVVRVPPGAFRPRPKVESAVVRLDVFDAPRVSISDEEEFFLVVRAGFSQKRKQLANSLSAGLKMPKELVRSKMIESDLKPSLRAEALSLEEWAALTRSLHPALSGRHL